MTFPFPIKPPFFSTHEFSHFCSAHSAPSSHQGESAQVTVWGVLTGVKDSPFLACNMEAKDFEITTDLLEMCQIKCRGVIVV